MQPVHVEALVVQCGLSPHCCAGTVQVKIISVAPDMIQARIIYKCKDH